MSIFLTIGLEHLLKHDADVADLNTWLRCRALSRYMKNLAMTTPSQNAKIYHIKGGMTHALDEAAQFAHQMISPKKWSEEDPRCCSLCCRGKGKTGFWYPRHVVLSRASQQDVTLIENQWWRNDRSARGLYGCSDPQKKLKEIIATDTSLASSSLRHTYVVCSEACVLDATSALETIHWRSIRVNRWAFQVILGVDRLVLIHDGVSDSETESSGGYTSTSRLQNRDE